MSAPPRPGRVPPAPREHSRRHQVNDVEGGGDDLWGTGKCKTGPEDSPRAGWFAGKWREWRGSNP